MITTSFVHPGERCLFLVRHYLILKADDPLEKICDRFVPEGYTGIVFNFQGAISAFDHKTKIKLPTLFYVPPFLKSLMIEIESPADSLIALCRTSAFSKTMGIDLSQRTANPHQLFGASMHLMLQSVLEASSTTARIEAFELAITQFTKNRPYQNDTIDDIYDQIIDGSWGDRVGDIAEVHHLNSRSLRRQFQQRVGITTKELIRIGRVHQAWSAVMRNPQLDNLDIAYLGGFYDQSHFIRDFKTIVGETPGVFFQRNLDHVSAISGKESE